MSARPAEDQPEPVAAARVRWGSWFADWKRRVDELIGDESLEGPSDD